MKAPAKLALAALLCLLPVFGVSAAGADLMVVFSSKSEVNLRAYNWIREVFQSNGINASVTATLDPSSVKPGQYKTVVVINTGVASGLDPVLKKFIDGYADKKGLFLVNLFQRRPDLKVTAFQAASTPEGVDGITAASTWGRNPFGSGDPRQMHLEWVQALSQFMTRS